MIATSTPSPLRLAIIGGGFTGAVLAIHAVRASTGPLDIVVLEPRAELGRGVAYSTRDRSHRINVPSDRLDIAAGEAGTATAWLHAHGILPDPESEDATGAYVPRAEYGAYIGDVLARTLAAAAGRVRLRHLRTTATEVRDSDGTWTIVTQAGERVAADRVALCFGHAVPALPCRLGPGVADSPHFVADPWAADALAGIGPEASVLVVGTGLTMADVVTSLGAGGHRGPITAVSRRGLLPKTHGVFKMDLDVVGGQRPATALELLRMIRRQISAVDPALGWHAVVDSLRPALPDLWGDLPADEKRRVVRRLLPFWEVHRFRIAPQIQAALARAQAEGRLAVERAAITGLDLGTDGGLEAELRRGRGETERRRFDAVVLCTGPERDVARNPLVAALLADGTASLDAVGLGLAVDRRSRVRDASGQSRPGLYAFGPMTRGSFGEMTGAPDIAQHIEQTVGGLLAGEP
ncbi:FAD/NAD(P)-binding protein [Methylobacterium sp. E-066]|uniref:FAD/NAD(P)-binding protein n=1 Tax=Methylobacterium sp. E-066 TaxID=2836584 RepID=UPI001FBB41BF|nr:FAD/NAD(P)-binding protein [Methylobacterium sp. E-066]MCJ2142346.1 FAD/NAD(P)-binding protein [Methylobacterium sp. E-066]